MRPEEVIVKPLLTEKSNELKDSGKYVFQVSVKSNKIQVRQSIKAIYGVTPVDCAIMNVKGKKKRQGRFVGKTSAWRKAIITLKKGDVISIFEGV